MPKKALLWSPLPDSVVKCDLCAHKCVISEGNYGVCGMRRNEQGILFTYAYGKIAASNVDPIEKKPLYHFLPGTKAFSIATMGCNFRCSFCQNWEISQANVRDGGATRGIKASPEDLAARIRKSGADSVSFTYTEPTVFFEYARDIAMLVREQGVRASFVTNGYMSREALDHAADFLDAANVDLKAFSDDTYGDVCGASLRPVLDTINRMKDLGIWVEVTTLLVPGLNDSNGEIGDIAGFIAGVDPCIPWHISRFYPAHNYDSGGVTPRDTLERAFDIGKRHGLKYIYFGNVLPGNDTVCPNCGDLVVGRSGFSVRIPERAKQGLCPGCGQVIEGVWS